MIPGEGTPASLAGHGPWPHRPWIQAAMVLAASLLISWPMLGRAGFSGTEGHRAIPAYHMLDGGPWLVPHLFDRPYLRKPPGMQWAIAGSSSLLGRTEFAARAVSATAGTLSALVCLWFGRRWFGPAGGLYAGLAFALMPVLWAPSRTADIESLHNLGVLLACLSVVDLGLRERGTPWRDRAGMALLTALGIFVAGVTKGPSGVTALAACLAALAIVRHSLRPLTEPAMAAGIAAGGLALGAVYMTIARATRLIPEETVTQSVDDFLWRGDAWWRILLLAPTSLLMALPASFALLFPWGPDAMAERRTEQARYYPLAFPAARTLTIAVLMSLGMLTIAGVSNPRYTMPTQVLIAPVAGYVGLGLAGLFILKRPPIARAFLLGHPAALTTALLVAAVARIGYSESWRDRVDGRAAGGVIAGSVPPGAILLSDHLVEARPDVLWYALQRGRNLRIVWRDLNTSPARPLDRGAYYVLRDDELSREAERFVTLYPETPFAECAAGSVYLFSFRVLSAVTGQEPPDTGSSRETDSR